MTGAPTAVAATRVFQFGVRCPSDGSVTIAPSRSDALAWSSLTRDACRRCPGQHHPVVRAEIGPWVEAPDA